MEQERIYDPMNDTPATIDELRVWYQAHNLPAEDITRFFIGKNYTKPRAFGIYEENGQYIVYKNKNDGSRAVRYHGPDEAYAVKELWLRLKQEISNQKAHQGGTSNRAQSFGAKRKIRGMTFVYIYFALVIVIWVLVLVFDKSPKKGYYHYENPNRPNVTEYYHLGDDWYSFYDGDWHQEFYVDQPLRENWKDYYQQSTWSESYDTTDFTDTTYYADYQESHSSDSSTWDSSDSWDSDFTDFDSDW